MKTTIGLLLLFAGIAWTIPAWAEMFQTGEDSYQWRDSDGVIRGDSSLNRHLQEEAHQRTIERQNRDTEERNQRNHENCERIRRENEEGQAAFEERQAEKERAKAESDARSESQAHGGSMPTYEESDPRVGKYFNYRTGNWDSSRSNDTETTSFGN